MRYIKNKYYFNYIFTIFPLLFITGPFLPDLFISLVDIFFLFLLVKDYKNFLNKNYYLYFFLIFYFYINFNSIIAYNSYYSLKVSFPYIRFILFSFIFGYLLVKTKNFKKIVIFSFLFTYIILIIDSTIQLIFGKNVLGYSISENRISSLFGDWLVMGSFVARTMPVILGMTFVENIKQKNFLQIFIIIISGILVIMSAERLAFVYFLITLISFLFFKINKKNFLITISLIILFFASIFYLRPEAYKRLFVHTFEQLKSADTLFSFSYRHELHYVTALNEFKDSMIFGHGLKSFRLLCDNPKYIPIKKMLKDNLIDAPISGYTFLLDKTLVIKSNNIAPINLNEKDIIYKSPILRGELIKIYVRNGEFIKKNQHLFSKYEFANGCNTHPHNVHLQFLAETGLIGYFFLVIALLFIVYRLFLIISKKFFIKFITNTEFCIFYCLLGLFLSLFPFFPSGNFFNNWLSTIFYFNVACLVSVLPLKVK
jgi:hypothetical protein